MRARFARSHHATDIILTAPSSDHVHMHGRVFGATSSLLAFVKEGHELPNSLQAGFTTGVSRDRPRLKWRAGWRPAAAGSASTASTDAPQGTATACRSRRRGRRCRRGRLTNRAACQQRRQSGCGQRRRSRARRCCRAMHRSISWPMVYLEHLSTG